MKYLVRDGHTVGYAEFLEGGMKLNKRMRFKARRRNPKHQCSQPYSVDSARLTFDVGNVPSYTQIAGTEEIA